MIKVYADGRLVYAPQLPGYELDELQVKLSGTASGTATITMPPGHPAMDAFIDYKTVVTIYRHDVLLFRGRALYPEDDFYNRRTITCEGERGFLQDSVVRPYLYQDSPTAIFEDLIAIHNSQVDASKAFVVGTVTVTDANDYLRMESSTAEQTADVLDKLVKREGGYIVFTTNDEGQRVIHWYADPGYRSGQSIQFGSNLLDFSRSGEGTDMATAIIPYGAENEETGQRVTIESVNDGLDFIQDDNAVALRGFIMRPVYWDDVTEPANLLTKAQQYLAKSRNLVTSLELSAVDLSALDKDIDSFRVLDLVRVRSKPHNVDEDFLLTERTYNLLDPSRDKVTLGKEISTLTSADAAGDRDNRNELHKTEAIIKADYKKGIASAIQETTSILMSLIQQTESKIMAEVSESYATNDEIETLVSTRVEQTIEGWEYTFSELAKQVVENDTAAREQYAEQKKYIRFVDGNIVLGEAGNELELQIKKDRISFYDAGAEVAYFSNKQLYVLDGHFLNSLRIGKFAFLPRENGNLSLVKVGE